MSITLERRLIWVLAAVQFTHIVDFMIMMPLGPELSRVFGINSMQFGLLVSAYSAASALASCISALVLDRFDRRTVMRWSYIMFALATGAIALADSFQHMMIARVMAGFFAGIVGLVAQTIIADVVPFERRGAAMGKIMAAFAVATVAGVPLGLIIANYAGWGAPFYALAAVSGVIYLFIHLWIPSITGHLEGPKESMIKALWEVLRTGRYALAYLTTIVSMLAGFVVIPFITLHLQGSLGLDPEKVPIIYLVGGVATLFTAPLIGNLADKYGKGQTFTVLAVAAVLPIYLITHLDTIAWVELLITTTLFFVLVSGRTIPSMAVISQVPTAKQRGAFMSLNNAVQSAAMALAAFVGGWLLELGPTPLESFQFNGYVGIAASLLSIVLLRQVIRTLPETPADKSSTPD